MILSSAPRTAASLCLSNVQNGVGNKILHCISATTGATGLIALSTLNVDKELESGTGCVPHPTTLGGSGSPAVIALQSHFSERTKDEGSLPSTPQMPSLDCGGVTEPFCSSYKVLEQDTRELIDKFLRTFAGLSRSWGQNNKALSTMKHVVDRLVLKHQLAYKGMIVKLNLEAQGDDMSVITDLARDTFSDGITNWGRIASLLAFGAVVSKHLKESGQEHCVSLVGDNISSYLLTNQQDWLIKNKAWDGFVEFFHVEDPESTVRKALMTLAGVAGIGAGLAFLIR